MRSQLMAKRQPTQITRITASVKMAIRQPTQKIIGSKSLNNSNFDDPDGKINGTNLIRQDEQLIDYTASNVGGSSFVTDSDGIINGTNSNDTLVGSSKDDTLIGADGDDLLIGGDGDDYLNGFGRGSPEEVDFLTGGAGSDTFVIGDSAGVDYQSGGSDDTEDLSFAIISDFSAAEDFIQASGSSSDYELDSSSDLLGTGIQDTGIYLGNDLIAIFENTTIDNFDRFTFVEPMFRPIL